MPRNLLSQLAHVELLSPEPQATVEFVKEVMGLEESHREGQSAWFRGWGEFFHHSLVITESDRSGLGHIGWRAYGPDDLDTAVSQIDAAGRAIGWVLDSVGHGPAYRFSSPEGHTNEVFWEVERWEAPPHMRSRFPNAPQRYNPRGMGLRRIDHISLHACDVPAMRTFYVNSLHFRYMESIHLDSNDLELGAFLTNTPMSHDLGLLLDATGVPGRLDHVAFWVDTPDELNRAADIAREHPVGLELGPERHAVGQNFCAYLREPGGNRLEVFTGPGYFNYEPDWEPRRWKVSQGPGSYYGRELPISFQVRGTPPVDEEARIEESLQLSVRTA